MKEFKRKRMRFSLFKKKGEKQAEGEKGKEENL